MPIFDIFKKRKKPEKVEKPEKKKPEKKPTKSSALRRARKVPEWVDKILKGVHVTEKASDLAKQNQYVFKVFAKANKIEIKKAIEQTYKVNVLKVRIINVPKKARTFGRTPGWKKGYKKAIVRIKPGQKIDVMPK